MPASSAPFEHDSDLARGLEGRTFARMVDTHESAIVMEEIVERAITGAKAALTSMKAVRSVLDGEIDTLTAMLEQMRTVRDTLGDASGASEDVNAGA